MSLLQTFGQGLHDIAGELYYERRLGEANKGALDIVDRSLYHYRYWVEDTLRDVIEYKAYTFGRAFHCLLLEPERYETDFVVLPKIGNRTKADRAAHARFADLYADKDRITNEQDLAVRRMVAAVRRHPLANVILSGGVAERTLVWKDPVTGLPCKARVDYYNEAMRLAVDPKTTLDGSAEAFARAAHRYRYHVQHAQYCDGFNVIGKPLDHFLFLCIEKDPPHAVSIYKLDAPGEELGYDKRGRNMARLAEGLRINHFPSYNNDKTAALKLPAFAFYEATDL